MTTKHTPGPWEAFKLNPDEYGQVMSSIWSKHVMIARLNPSGPNDERQANARLIAAAPDLLEALEAMLCLDNQDNGEYMADAITDLARAAIAKATGE